ncbi:MAG: glycosyltransferase family 4 protein, partial [Candidatus Aureabacteria bacterium]|nr:glycosyltransferase family 4 protein [Candidatus Auribacterota bacterium]
ILDRYILRYFDKIVAVSDALAHFLKGKVREDALLVIPNGIKIEEFSRETDILKKKREIGFDERDMVIGTIGRISPEKGHIYLLKAAKEVCRTRRNVKFIIIGDGPVKKELERWVFKNNLSDRIIFTGSIEEIKEVLSVFDIFVLPSQKEAFGLSLLEAMACGKAVIATDIGGIPSIVENDKLGVLIKPRNIGLMSDAILELLGDENRRLDMGANARNYVNKKYSIDSMIKAYEKLYRDLAL